MIRIERRLIAGEYFIDSTNAHVIRKGCQDVRPIALSRYSKGLGKIRGALRMVRNEMGHTQWTLFAGSGGKERGGSWGRQKPWRHNKPHGWKKDCDIMGLEPEIEEGIMAECWHCDHVFRKEEFCEDCSFFKCPQCEGCACSFDAITRGILEKTVRAVSGRTQAEFRNREQ